MAMTFIALDPASMAAFAAGLTGLPQDEIQKAKKLYILNAIADFEAMQASSRSMVITFGWMCIIPIFLIVFIPSLVAYRANVKAGRQKIVNAIEVWKDDLGDDYESIHARIPA